MDTKLLDELNDEFTDTYGALVKYIHGSVNKCWSKVFTAMKKKYRLGVKVFIAT